MSDILKKMCKTRNSNKHSKRKPSRYGVRTVVVNDDMCQNTENVEDHYAFSITVVVEQRTVLLMSSACVRGPPRNCLRMVGNPLQLSEVSKHV